MLQACVREGEGGGGGGVWWWWWCVCDYIINCNSDVANFSFKGAALFSTSIYNKFSFAFRFVRWPI